MSLLILSFSLSLFLSSSKGVLLIFKSFSFLSILFCSSNIFSLFILIISLLSLLLIITCGFFKILFTDFFLIFFVTTFLGLLILLLSFLLLFPLIIFFFIVFIPFRFLLSTLSLILFFLNFLLFSLLFFSFLSKNKFFFMFSISFFSNNCNWLLFNNFSLTFFDKFSSTSLSKTKVMECLWPLSLISWLLSFLNEVCFNILFNLFIFFLLLVLPLFFRSFLSSEYKGLNKLYSSFLFLFPLPLFFTGERFAIFSSLSFFHISFKLELLLS